MPASISSESFSIPALCRILQPASHGLFSETANRLKAGFPSRFSHLFRNAVLLPIVLALILFVGMTEANKYFSTVIACLINTVLILLFAAYLVKKDFPLKSLPVVGRYFRK